MKTQINYDVIVIGAGHAGCEAALAAARIGARTAIFTIDKGKVALMSCNPAIGGPAKGQIVGEIDALGGEMGKAADATFIQIKTLNRSRGPAVQCLRSQNDKWDYSNHMKQALTTQRNLTIIEATIEALLFDKNKVIGVKTSDNTCYNSKTVVITTGTFLNGTMYTGLTATSGGRIGETAVKGLTPSLKKFLKTGRLKTGTPPRLNADTIDFSKMTIQPGDPEFLHFSFRTKPNEKFKSQKPCYLTHTTAASHSAILSNLDRSPLYTGIIKGLGPRYCPSIEDKVVRFKDKDTHQIFIEPEGWQTNSIYPQGLNTSLPKDVQEAIIHNMPGLEKAEILIPGYGIEYDFVYPDQLYPSLETRPVQNLYLAGQINGTSGYEEAAGQGIVAGINAALKSKNKDPLILTREDSYIGTMIDDLINKEIKEPYRMLTSRSEYRIILRQDNATTRLSEKGYQVGSLTKAEITQIRNNNNKIAEIINYWKNNSITDLIVKQHQLKQKTPIINFIKRQGSTLDHLIQNHLLDPTNLIFAKQALIEVRYQGYLNKQRQEIDRIQKFESKPLPTNIDYTQILGLKKESKEKLNQYQPKTIFEAKRIAGINPADILVLIAYLNRKAPLKDTHV